MATSILNVKVATNEHLELGDTINLGYQTIDGVIIRAGDRILVKAQGSGSLQLQNGIYAPDAAGVLKRTADFGQGSKQKSGQLIVVSEGESFKDTGWTLATDTVDSNVTVGNDPLIFSRFSINSNLVGIDVPSSIILRSEKGYPLTITELDNNFKYLSNGLTEKLNIIDFNPKSITDKINSISAATASLDAWELRGLEPSVEVVENARTIAVRNTDGSLTSNLFIGDLRGRANIATNADMATLAGNVTGVVAVVNGGTGANNNAQARINLGAVGSDGTDPMTGKLILSPSSTLRASVNMAQGTAPSAPVDGDIWSSGASLFYRLASVTETVAPLRSPAFVGTPTAPTAAKSSNSTNLATTAYVWLHVNALNAVIDLKAPIASPALTGTPTAPTPARSDNSTRIATTAFALDLLNSKISYYYDKPTIDLKLANLKNELQNKISIADNKAQRALEQAGIPVGSVVYFAANSIPIGYLKCNGALVSTTAYPRLFEVIGYTYGGSGAHFRLPDLRGEFVRGFDDGRGIDPGRGFASWQKGTMVGGYDDNDASSHASVLQSRGSNDYGSDLVTAGIAANLYSLDRIKWTIPQGEAVYPTAHAASWVSITRPRNVALMPCIKAFGDIQDPDLITATQVLVSISDKVDRRGDTLTGALTLSGAPTLALHAATKKYVDDTSAYIQNNFASNTALSGRIARTGDTMTGALTLSGTPTAALHAATKQYVDNAVADAKNSIAKPYAITAGVSYAVGFTDYIDRFADSTNYFDVFPPAGKSMNNIVGFIPSIHVIHFAGDVNRDDSLRCTYSYLSDRIRVYVQNTEQRAKPAANWLAIWS